MLSKHVCFIRTFFHLAINFLFFIKIARINIRRIKIVLISHRFNHNVLSSIIKHFKILMRRLCKITSTEIKLSIKIFIKQINSLNHYQINVFKTLLHQQIQTRTLINIHYFVLSITSIINLSHVIFSSQFSVFIMMKQSRIKNQFTKIAMKNI